MTYRKIWWNEEELKYYAETASGETISVSQVVHVNFAGGSDLSYHNAQLGVNIDDISVDHADFSAEEIATILTTLNANDAGIVFVSDQSLLSGLTDYSTIYVGETHAFDALGRVKAISETTGKTAAAVRNDNAFVLMQNIGSMNELIETIWHETGHLTGDLAHDDSLDGLTIDDFMATYSTPQTVAEGESKTFTGDLFKKNSEGKSLITNNGKVTLTGVTCAESIADQGGALCNYGTATITDSTFLYNYARDIGGAIYNWGPATLYIANSTFRGNRSLNGKAIYNDGTIIIGGLITLDVGQNIFNNATITVDGSKFSFADGAFAKAIDGYEGWCLGKGTVYQGTYNATSGYYVYFNENDGDLYVGNSSMIAVVADTNTTTVTVNGVTYQGKYYNTLSAAFGSGLKTIALSGTTQNAKLDIVAGITFASTGTLFNNSSSAENGGAIYNKGLVELESSAFNDNSTSRDGGAIFNSIGGRAVINGGAFHGNTASYSGGAIYNDRGPLSVGTVTITGSTFDKNSAENNGGAVDNAGTATISASTFTDNSSRNGGAITSFDMATITASSFIGNIATQKGGAIYNTASGGGTGTITISGSTFSKNTAGVNGGAICNDASAEITGSTFSGNSAVEYGGAIYTELSSSLFIANSIFRDNTANLGGAIFNNGTATISGSTFSGNTGAIYNNRTLTISNLTFTGNTGAIYNKDILTIEGLISLTTASDTIYNDFSITVDGSKFDCTNGPVRVVDAIDANWLESGSLDFTVTDGYWLYRDADNIDLYITNQLTTAVVAADKTYTVTVNGTTYNGPYFSSVEAAFTAGATTVALSGTTRSTPLAVAAGKTFAVEGATFTGILVSSGGRAITNEGTTIISNSTFSKNTVMGLNGCCVRNNSGTLIIENTQFIGNYMSGSSDKGGAIYLSNGTATINNSIFIKNRVASTTYGGAIYNAGSQVTISGATFSENSAKLGGAIFNSSDAGSVIVIAGLITLTTASDTIYNAGTITVDGAKFDYTQGPVKVVDAFDANWLENGSKDFTVTNGYWLYRDSDHIDLLITNQLTTAVVTQDGTYAVTVNGTTYNGPRFSTVEAAFTAGATTVALSGTTRNTQLTVASGKTFAALGTLFEGSSASSDGGAITNSGTAIVSGATFSGNTVASGKSGGAICNRGTLTLENSNFSGNGGYYGGAIYSYNPTELAINGSSFSDNSAVGNGGAIYNSGGILSISNTTFTNSSSAWNGGAVFARSQTTITNSTFLGNSSGKGGAVYNESTLTITGSTFSGNKARTGGAIYNSSGTGSAIIIAGLITLTTASDTIYNAATITVDGSKFDCTQGPVKVVDAFDANWLEAGSNNFTVTDGYWLYRDADNIDLLITNQLTTAVVTANQTYAVTVNGTIYNGPRFTSIAAALSAGATTVAAEGITLTAHMQLFQKKTIVLKDISFSEVSYNGMGGAIYNDIDGEWIIQDSTFNGNSATSGGAIANDGKVTIGNSTFSGNSASGNGGAIYNVTGTMTISDCTFTANTAAGGGAIHNFGTMTIGNSTFSGNSANAAGAIFNQGNLYLSNTSFLTVTDTIYNVGTMSLSGKMIFRGNLGSYGVLTATDAEIEFSASELRGAITASGNSSLTFTNTAQTAVYGVHTGFTSIGFAGTTVSFSDAQDWSGVNITISNHTVIDGSEFSLVVATGSFTFDGANFTINGVSVTLGNSFTINGKEYLLSYNNTDLILERELVVNSSGSADFVSVADLFLAHPDYTGKIKVTGGTFTKDEFFNGCEGSISNLNSNYSIYGGKNGSEGGDVNLTVADSTVNMVFGGSSNGKNGVVKVTFSNSSANYLYATAIGEANGTTLILNNSTVAKEIQGSTLNSNNSKGSTIQMNGGSYGGSDYFFVYTGLKVASAGNVELTYAQYGDSLLTLNNVTLNDKSHLFAGGYGYGAGNAKAEAQIIGNTSISMTGCTINSSVSIYGGGRTDGFGLSAISGNSSITVSGITVSTGSTLNIFGGGYNNSNGGYENLQGDVTITVSGANNINGKLNIYGGGINIGSGTSSSVIGGSTHIQIGTAGMTDRISLNNVYGGGIGNVDVNGNTTITFAGRGQITMSGTLSGDGVTAGNVGGSKFLNFDRFSGTLGAIAVKNFDVVNLDANSSVVFTNRLNLDTVNAFNFTIDEERTQPDTAILDFAGGIAKWSTDLTISVVVGDGGMFDGTTLTLISALDSLDGWVGKTINLTTKSGLSDNLWSAVIGEDVFDATSGNTYRFDLVDFDNNGHMDGLQMTMTGANGGGLPSALSDMVNSLALDNLALGARADLGGILDWNKQNNGMLA